MLVKIEIFALCDHIINYRLANLPEDAVFQLIVDAKKKQPKL